MTVPGASGDVTMATATRERTVAYPVPAGWESDLFLEQRKESGRLTTREFQWFRRVVARTAPSAPQPPSSPVLSSSIQAVAGGDLRFPPGSYQLNGEVSPCQTIVFPGASQTHRAAQSNERRDAAAAAALSSIPAFAAMRSTREALVVGFDTEFGYLPDDSRYISSYQFAVPVPGSPHLVYEVVLAPLDVHAHARLTLETTMELLVRLTSLWEHPLCTFGKSGVPHDAGRVWPYHDKLGRESFGTFDVAVAKSSHSKERDGLLESRRTRPGRQVEFSKRREYADWVNGEGLGWVWKRHGVMRQALPLTLVGHYGIADMGTFFYDGDPYRVDFLRQLMGIGGGKTITGRWPVEVLAENHAVTGHRRRHFPVQVTVRDTMALVPAGFGSLEAIGDLVGHAKVKIAKAEICDMASFSRADTARWLEYGANDPLVCLEYTTALFGDGRKVPATLASASARAVKRNIISVLGIDGTEERSRNKQFKALYSGERPLDISLEQSEDGMTFRTVQGWTALDGDAENFQNGCAKAFRGGYNGCSEVGYFDTETRDFDLKGAYLASAALVWDVDFLHDDGVVEASISKRLLTLDDVPDWQTPFVGFVCWEFPSAVKYPTLPSTVGSSTVYARSALNRRDARAKARAGGRSGFWELGSGSWVMGPEVRAALLLGAEVWCQVGYRAHVLEAAHGGPSRCLAASVKSFVEGRSQAAEMFGSKSLPALALKEGGNSVYGKTAQDVTPTRSWNAWKQSYEDTGGSSITSPYHASMITSLVRTVLLLAQNELHSIGRKVVSVTTDGMITDATVDEVSSLDLFGLNGLFASARQELVGDPTVWEVKHSQTELFNFTTRGNISIQSGGVVAQNGYHNPFDKESVEGREHFARLVLGRTGPIQSTAKVSTTFADMTRLPLEKRKEFKMVERSTDLHMDFDLKRRPILKTMSEDLVPLGGETFDVAHFDTEPWDDADECRHAKQVARSCHVLRTVEDWRAWDMRARNSSSTVRITKPGATILRSIVKGHRARLWSVPNLDAGTVADKLAWLQTWGFVEKPLTDSWWRNLGRADRSGSAYLLPTDELEPYLSAMEAMPVGVTPSAIERFSLGCGDGSIRSTKCDGRLKDGRLGEPGDQRWNSVRDGTARLEIRLDDREVKARSIR